MKLARALLVLTPFAAGYVILASLLIRAVVWATTQFALGLSVHDTTTLGVGAAWLTALWLARLTWRSLRRYQDDRAAAAMPAPETPTQTLAREALTRLRTTDRTPS